MRSSIPALALATAAFLTGAVCTWIGLRSPGPPPHPSIARRGELQRELDELRTARDELAAKIRHEDEQAAERERILALPDLLEALELDSKLTAPFIGILTRDATGHLLPCETLLGRTPSDSAGYLDGLLDSTPGTWIIGRVKYADDMTHSTRFCHTVGADGVIQGIESGAPVTLDQVRAAILKLRSTR